MSLDYRSLANHYISSLVPYQPGKPIEEVERELGISSPLKLASNENALGPSPKSLVAAQTALLKSHIYPDGNCFELKQTLARFLKIETHQLTIGNGSENILEIIVNAYLGIEDEAIICQYAFLTIPLLIKSHGGKCIQVPAKNYSHDIPGMIAAVTAKTKLIFIVNPNNPTGTYITHEELIGLLDSIPPNVLVVLDEAYYEYMHTPDYPNTISLLNRYPNLLITRTFSKVYGLAALRLGYAISSIEIADILNRARLPFNVNSIAAMAACAAISDHEHVKNTLHMTQQGNTQLLEQFKKMQIESIPSSGNFITFDVKTNALKIYQKLLHEGVIVRPLSAYNMPSHLRVTIGTTDQNERFLKALHRVIGH